MADPGIVKFIKLSDDSSLLVAKPTSSILSDLGIGGTKQRTKQACVAATDGVNININSAPVSIDGVTLNNENRILLKDQNNAIENGVYVFTSSGNTLNRASDFDDNNDVLSGAIVHVLEGTNNADTTWVLTIDDVDLGTDSLTFTRYDALNKIDKDTTATPTQLASYDSAGNLTKFDRFEDELVGKILEEDTTNNSIRIKDSITGTAPNTLGDNAIDLQGIRNDPTQTASGLNSTINNGQNNTASSVWSFVNNGYGNTASGPEAFVSSGTNNTASGGQSFVGNGYGNTASAPNSSVGNGENNTASHQNSFVITGNYTKTDNVDEVSAGTTNNLSEKENGKLMNLALFKKRTGAGIIDTFIIPNGSVAFGTIYISGASEDGAECWGAEIKFTAKRDASGVTAIKSKTIALQQTEDAGDGFNLIVDSSNALEVNVSVITFANPVAWTAAITASVTKFNS